MISGIYFDGRNAQAHDVKLLLRPDAIQLIGQHVDLLIQKSQMHMQEPFASAASIVDLGNGTHCEIQAAEDKALLAQALNYQASWVERWQSKWLAALAAVVCMVGMLLAAYFWGLPWVAEKLADHIPDSVEQSMGKELLPLLDQSIFKKSKLSDSRIQQAQEIFAHIKPEHSRIPLTLAVRDAKQMGPNAIALPGGTIVVTDQLIHLITGDNNELTGGLADELAAVLAHEIGHVERKHALKSLVNNSVVTAAAVTLFGDFSAVASSVPAMLVGASYSRNMETEADDYAVALLKAHNISPDALADALDELQNSTINGAGADVPRWMRTVTNFAASHPSTPERIARVRRAAQE